MKRIRKFTASVAAAGLLMALQPKAHGVGRTYIDTTLDLKGGISIELILAAAVFIWMLISMINYAKQGKSGRINVPWAVLSAFLSGFAVLLCIVGVHSGTLYTKAEGDPAETVKSFFDALIAQDYATAYSHLNDYSTLGLENPPESDNARLAYDALLESYDYRIMGGASINKLEARVPVMLRYLDMPSFEKSVESRTNDNLAEFVKNNPISQVYDENDQYLPSVTEKAYSDALAFILDKADTYYSSAQFEVKLEYKDGQWLIISDEQMHKALAGNTIY